MILGTKYHSSDNSTAFFKRKSRLAQNSQKSTFQCFAGTVLREVHHTAAHLLLGTLLDLLFACGASPPFSTTFLKCGDSS